MGKRVPAFLRYAHTNFRISFMLSFKPMKNNCLSRHLFPGLYQTGNTHLPRKSERKSRASSKWMRAISFSKTALPSPSPVKDLFSSVCTVPDLFKFAEVPRTRDLWSLCMHLRRILKLEDCPLQRPDMQAQLDSNPGASSTPD